MDRKWCKKLKQIIKDGRSSKFKSYIEKHEINIQHLQFRNGKTLLHYCCKYQNFNGFRYLIERGIDASIKDDDGNTALHIALKEALKTNSNSDINEVYQLLILPIIEKHPESLRWRNHDDMTCRDLLDQLREKQEETPSSESPEPWEDKLAAEVEHEHHWEWGRYSGGHQDEEDFAENYEDWSHRMHKEYHRKRKQAPTLPKSTKKSKVTDDFEDKLKRDREKMRQKYEENQKKAQHNFKRHKKDRYEQKWEELSVKLSAEKLLCSLDFPWPFKDNVCEMEDFLLHDVADNDARKKYLRDQMKRWHPDKFEQKFSDRVVPSEKEHIFLRVKQVSQQLNHLFEKLKNV